MKSRLFLKLSAFALPALLVSCGQKAEEASSSAEGSVLRFTAIPDTNMTELKAKYDPVAAYLGEKLGVEVEYVPSDSYSASVEMFKNGDIQFAWFGGLSGVQARAAIEGARAIVQGDADPNFKSYIIAHKDTGLTPNEAFPSEIGKLSFTFGSESSTSGRLMPSHFIQESTGMKVEEFFEQAPGFSGAHDKTCELVAAGSVQTGAVNFKTYDKMVAEGKIDPAVCIKIWETPTYADYNLTAHPEVETLLGAGGIDKLQAALIGIKDEELLKAFDRNALITAKNEDFDGIVKVAQALGFVR